MTAAPLPGWVGDVVAFGLTLVGAAGTVLHIVRTRRAERAQ